MWPSLHESVGFLGLALLLLVNAAGVFMVALQLPGTWLMLVATGLMAWWRPEHLGWFVLLVLLGLAILGEVVEAGTASARARMAGGSRRGAVLALIGGVVGALLGTFVIPAPVVGTVAGACIGAGAGSMAGDRWAGRNWQQAKRSGRAAAEGRLLATVLKLGIAVLMWLIVAAAVLIR